MSPVGYELGSFIPESDIHHSNRRENLKYYTESYFFWTASVLCQHHAISSVAQHVLSSRICLNKLVELSL
jgi:hypothetical protein